VNYVIRDLERAKDMVPLEDVQLAAWGFSTREVVPGSMFVVGVHTGGVVAAAYPEGSSTPVGFVYGFPALRGGALVHHSHMLALVPEHRGSGLASRLKLHQRERVLKQGLGLMTWTMDPLLALNARLNLGKLGARAVAYHPDWYALRTGIYAGLAADRFMLEWNLTREPLEREAGFAEGTRALEARGGDPFQGPLDPVLGLEDRALLVELPRDIEAVKARDLETARAWRAATRAALSHYLGRGYAAVDLVQDGARTFYSLVSGPL